MYRTLFGVSVVALIAGNALAQEADSSPHGFSLSERFQGSANTFGSVNKLDSTLVYAFNSHFTLDGGIPLYFVRPSSSTIAATGTSSTNGIGNAYLQGRFSLANPILNYESTLTGTAPTGDKTVGLSTGHATADWTNYFDHSFSNWTPFFAVGLANAVSDTMFFIRPYTSYGPVAHLEGGLRYRLARAFTLGGSAYSIDPWGQQTVISRVVKAQGQPPAAASSGAKDHGVFQNAYTTTGPASIAADHGLSTWLQFAPVRSFNLYAGFTRSTEYSLNTVFFGVGLSMGKGSHPMGN
jgi:hypothetical protein